LPDPLPARGAARNDQPPLRDRIPKRQRVEIRDRPRRQRFRRSAHHGSFENTTAPVGTTFPLVTRQCRTSSACAVDSPRTWRTPSTSRLNPCTYASESPPPLVLYGGFFSSRRESAPAPSSQNPNSWKNSGTCGVNAA